MMNCSKNSSSGFYFGLGVFSQPPFLLRKIIWALRQILLIGKNQVMQPGSFFVLFDDNKCGRPYDQNYEIRRLFVESA